jgi:hypothetical protein
MPQCKLGIWHQKLTPSYGSQGTWHVGPAAIAFPQAYGPGPSFDLDAYKLPKQTSH